MVASMLINSVLDSEDFVHFYYADEVDGEGVRGRSRCDYGDADNRRRSLTPPPTNQCCGGGGGEQYCVPDSWHSSCSSSGSGGSGSDSGCGEMSTVAAPPPAATPLSADAYPLPNVERDEPGLQVPFGCLYGEGPQYLGRTQDGAVLVLTNYRLYHSGASIPVRLIDTIDVKDIFFLHISCKDARYLKLSFASGDTCSEWARRMSAAIAPPSHLDTLFAFAYAAWSPSLPPPLTTDPLQDYYREFDRLGFETSGLWRITRINMDYRLCPSYPQLLVVPASISDETLESVARFRSARRIPAVVWRHRGNGAVIARSSQPEVGWLGWRSEHDERMLAALVAACNHNSGTTLSNGNVQHGRLNRAPVNVKPLQRDSVPEMNGDVDDGVMKRLLIVDARSYASAVTNRARGGGCECTQYYTTADIQFMCLPNIHYVRRSFHSLRSLTADPDQPGWYGMLEKSLWLQVVGGLLRGACQVARAVMSGRPVLVHCSDGWDRTPQLTATAQLLLDPAYRTIQGFRTLVEREWLDFGHKFADRCGHAVGTEDLNERCPVFVQWLDCVHQIMKQYPCSFEFNEAFLVKLGRHAHATLTGTFLCNTGRERRAAHVAQRTACAWALLKGARYRNPLYTVQETPLTPESSMRALRLWTALYVGSTGGGEGETAGGEESMASPPATTTPPTTAPPSPSPSPSPSPEPNLHTNVTTDTDTNRSSPLLHRNHTEGLSKARSYSELFSQLVEEENGNVQRRSSDSQLSDNHNKGGGGGMMMSALDLSKSSPTSGEQDMLESYFGGSEVPDLREDLSEHFSMEENSLDRGTEKAVQVPNGHAKLHPAEHKLVNGVELHPRDDVDNVDGLTNGQCGWNDSHESEAASDSPLRLIPNGNMGQRVSKLSMNLANTKLRQEASVIYRKGAGVGAVMEEDGATDNSPGASPDEEPCRCSPKDDLFPEVTSSGEQVVRDVTRRCRNSSLSWRSVSESSQQTDSSGGGVDLGGWLVASPPIDAPHAPHVANFHPHPQQMANRRRIDSVHNGSLNDAAATLLEAEIGKLLSAEANGTCGLENGEDTTLCPNTPQHRMGARAPRRTHRPTHSRTAPLCCTNNNHSLNGNSWYDISAERMESSCGSCTVCGECCCCGPGERDRDRDREREKPLADNSVESSSSPACCRSSHHCRWLQRVPCVCGLGPDGALDGVVDPTDGLSCPHSPIQARLHQIILEHKMREEALSRELRAARAALVRRGTPPAVALHPHPQTPTPATNANTADNNSHSHTPQGGEEDVMTVSRCIADALMSDDHFPSFYDHFTVEDNCQRREPPECKRLEEVSVPSPGTELWNSYSVDGLSGPKCQRCDTEFWHGKRKHNCRRCGQVFCGDCSERWRGSPTPGGGRNAPSDERQFDSHRVCVDCAASLTTKPTSCCLYVEESSRSVATLHDSPPQPSS